ncbi:MAG: hypothetical protein EBS01_09605 [Verrucomicrobia bacterium]|nr:hypothetical protein [Verrucomicrobiota bacterium]
MNAGKLEAVRDGGDAPGTQIEVRSLFYNLPARRKFLRTEATEASHVEHQLHLLALGHPSISFVHLVDDRLALQLPPAPSLLDRIRDLVGGGLAGELLEVPVVEENGIRISGYLGRAGVSRSSRQQQLCFLNGRAVENITLSQGLREGYHTALMKGQHPVTFLFIEMDPAAVDVNVHPAKREVRFRAPSEVRDVVIRAVRGALEGDRARWSGEFKSTPSVAPVPEAVSPKAPPQPDLPLPAQTARPPLRIPPAGPPPSTSANSVPAPSPIAAPVSAPTPPELPPHEEPELPPAPVPETFRFLGVLGKLFVLMENASGLVLVDQHAAHERILFEEMQRRMEVQGVPSQRLLIPLTRRGDVQGGRLADVSQGGRPGAIVARHYRRPARDQRSGRASTHGAGYDSENGLQARGESKRHASGARTGQAGGGPSALRPAVLLSARTPDHDSAELFGIGKEIRPQGLEAKWSESRDQGTRTRETRRRSMMAAPFFSKGFTASVVLPAGKSNTPTRRGTKR